jgi:hypothetical protein
MRIVCRHGHFAFYPRRASELARFSNYFSAELLPERDYYTFAELIDAPSYSLAGLEYLGIPAIETFEGDPWNVMRENGFVFNLTLGKLVPKQTITSIIELPFTGFYFSTQSPLIQPGTKTVSGKSILSYGAEFIEEGYGIRILEFNNE